MQAQRATADKILDASSKLFAEKGFSNVSVRDICKASGTTAPVIYYHFGNKKGLFDAVARKQISMEAFIRRLESVSRSEDPKRGLAAFIKTYLSSFPEHAFDTGLYLRDSAMLDKQSARMASDDLDRVRKMVFTLVERAMDKGYFRKTDAGMAADCLLGMLNRVIFQHIHFSRISDRDSYMRFVTEFFFRAMQKES
ncbi:MAG: TetR/AcrR family transcriptional regulator [Thaumarchaeota archaeon]|nr:TetR/AcrR family transcriptional regulator [Nitrososphaerota archaeon]